MYHGPDYRIGPLTWLAVTATAGNYSATLDFRPLLPYRVETARMLLVVIQAATDPTAAGATTLGLSKGDWRLPTVPRAARASPTLWEIWEPLPAYWDGGFLLVSSGMGTVWSVGVARWANPSPATLFFSSSGRLLDAHGILAS